MAKINTNELYDDSQSESLHIRAANSLRSEAALITKEQIEKAMQCKTAEELIAAAKARASS